MTAFNPAGAWRPALCIELYDAATRIARPQQPDALMQYGLTAHSDGTPAVPRFILTGPEPEEDRLVESPLYNLYPGRDCSIIDVQAQVSGPELLEVAVTLQDDDLPSHTWTRRFTYAGRFTVEWCDP